MPQGGYVGEYMIDVAKEIADQEGDRLLHLPAEQAIRELGRIGLGKMLQGIQSDMERLRIDFDVWFREHTLYSDGQYEKSMDMLARNNPPRGEGGRHVVRVHCAWRG